MTLVSRPLICMTATCPETEMRPSGSVNTCSPGFRLLGYRLAASMVYSEKALLASSGVAERISRSG